jgi:hypothetical protein
MMIFYVADVDVLMLRLQFMLPCCSSCSLMQWMLVCCKKTSTKNEQHTPTLQTEFSIPTDARSKHTSGDGFMRTLSGGISGRKGMHLGVKHR